MLSFKQYYKLNESPDVTYAPDASKCTVSDPDARAFGWLKLHPEIPAVCIGSSNLMKIATHIDLYTKLTQHLQLAHSGQIHNRFREQLITLPDLDSYTQQCLNNPTFTQDLLSGKILQNITDTDADVDIPTHTYPDTAADLHNELASDYRNLVFSNSGRLWLDRSVISFWNKSGDVPASRAYTALALYNIPTHIADNWYIDVINPQNISAETTPHKTLPTLAQYFSKQHTDNTPDNISAEIKKLLTTQHTITHPTLKKYISANTHNTTHTANIPLHIRQASITSESKSHST